MKETVVLYPGMGVGHLVPMVALAKLFLRHNFAVSIAVIDPPKYSRFTAQAISSFAASNPAISFHLLPSVPIPPEVVNNPFKLMFQILSGNNPNLLNFISELRKTENVRAIVLDFFCTGALKGIRHLGIPTYFFMASGAGCLAAFLHITVLDKTLPCSFKEMGKTPINLPGLPLMRASDIPQSVQDRTTDAYKTRIENWPRLIEADGILINSFEELESKALIALRDGLCIPDRKMPPVYCVGPLITQGEDKEKEKEEEPRHESLTWLDSQPKGSVVFLCFGSMGAFLPQQIKQIAVGLEKSGQKFLWVVKTSDDPNNIFESQPQPELSTLLPQDFLSRTKDQGLAVKSWAPQAQILRHAAVGGFVTHCGWNSVLEAVTAGVPLICWPLYAEQRLNKVIVTEDLKVGVEMRGYDEEMVRSEEVEEKVRWLIESEGGKKMKENMMELRKKAMDAIGEEGSSSKAFVQFLTDLGVTRN